MSPTEGGTVTTSANTSSIGPSVTSVIVGSDVRRVEDLPPVSGIPDLEQGVQTTDSSPPNGPGGPPAADQAAGVPLLTIPRWMLLLCRSLAAAMWIGLLVWQQVSFSSTWGNDCSYDIQVWASVWLAGTAISSVLTAVKGAFVPRQLLRTTVIRLFLLLFEFFLFIWVLYGIPVIFVYPRGDYCNMTAYRWALTGFCYQMIVTFLPCILIILLMPILAIGMHNERFRNWIIPLLFGPPPPATTNQQPTPPDVIEQVTRMKWAEVLELQHKMGKTDPTTKPTLQELPTQTSMHRASLIHQAMPSPLTTAVSQVLTRMASNEQAGDPSQGGGLPGSGGVPGSTGLAAQASRALTHAGRSLSIQKPMCPICFMEFDDDADVMCLPCSPLTHIYHSDCLKEWLGKSQHCPMCRANIVEIIRGPPASTVQPASDSQAHHVVDVN